MAGGARRWALYLPGGALEGDLIGVPRRDVTVEVWGSDNRSAELGGMGWRGRLAGMPPRDDGPPLELRLGLDRMYVVHVMIRKF